MALENRHKTSDLIASFIARVRLRDISREILETATLHVLDGFATMVSGVREEASRVIRQHLLNSGAAHESSVIGTNIKVPAQQAALANGVQGHVLDFDDAQLATLPSRPFGQQTHPTTPVLAASLAVAEKIGAKPAALLAAYTVGVEVACRLGDAVAPNHYLEGFHPTGTLGTFGATAAAAHLLSLNTRQIGSALGIAGTLAAGLRANRGTMAKALNAGRAAENGVLAATLASLDFTGSLNVFDDRMGFFSAACRNQVDRKLLRFGRPYFFTRPGVAVKLYPCAGVLHPLLDIVLKLTRRHIIPPRQVQYIRVTIHPTAALPLVYDRPTDGLQAKFSLPFAAAVALIDKEAGLEQFTTERVRDRSVRDLMRQVELLRAPSTTSDHSESATTQVEIQLKNGQRYKGKASIARGHPQRPLSRSDIEEKFRECAGHVLRPQNIERFLQTFWTLEKCDSLSALLRPLRSMRG
jgi:2-methylcitrate dehydratase PrpD